MWELATLWKVAQTITALALVVEHKGEELCLPEAALNGHLKHGDEETEGQAAPTPPVSGTGGTNVAGARAPSSRGRPSG